MRSFLALRDFRALRDFLTVSALHPRRRARGGGIVCGYRLLVLIALGGARLYLTRLGFTRLYLVIGPAHARERIGLADQPSKFSQRIAFGLFRRALVSATIMIVVRRNRSTLISISHRDDASPSGKPANPHFYKRTGPCQMPSQIPV
jgi:hypothetical protein